MIYILNKKQGKIKNRTSCISCELAAEMAKKGENQKDVADLLYVSTSAVNRKIRGLTDSL